MLKSIALSLAFVAGASSSVGASCEHSQGVHGGDAFLAHLVGQWRAVGKIDERAVDANASATWEGQALRLFLPTQGATVIHYDRQCDDFQAILDGSPGKGVERAGSVDITFNQSSARRNDLVLTWDPKLRSWMVLLNRERSRDQWQKYGELKLTRS